MNRNVGLWLGGMATVIGLISLVLGYYQGLWWGVTLFLAFVTFILWLVLYVNTWLGGDTLEAGSKKFRFRIVMMLFVLTVALSVISWFIHGWRQW